MAMSYLLLKQHLGLDLQRAVVLSRILATNYSQLKTLERYVNQQRSRDITSALYITTVLVAMEPNI